MNDFVFAYPQFLWGAAAGPLMLLVLYLMRKRNRQKLEKLAKGSALVRLNTEYSQVRALTRIILISLGMIFVFIAAAQPKFGMKTVPVERRGVDLIIALDVSKSMETEDIKPNRLQRARISIRNLLNTLGGDRIGLVVFAGEAALIHPLTTRAAGFMLTLDTLNTDAIPLQGTALADAIKTARESFEPNSVKNKVLILITDGETHDEGAAEEARLAAEEGITIYTIGIGTQRGDKIPDYIRDGEVVDYKKVNGRYVFSKLNASLLQEIASIGKGRYFHYVSSDDDVLNALYADLNEDESEEKTQRQYDLMNDIYQIPLSLAIIMIGTAIMVGNRKEE